jgi:hypothetical protein
MSELLKYLGRFQELGQVLLQTVHIPATHQAGVIGSLPNPIRSGLPPVRKAMAPESLHAHS